MSRVGRFAPSTVPPPRMRRLVAHAMDRARRWRAIAALVPRAGGPLAVSSVLLNVVLGLLPLGFVVGTSVLLDRIPAVVLAGEARWSQAVPAFGLALAALVLQHALAPVQAALGELVSRRVDGHCVRRLMVASLADAPMEMLERPEVLDRLGDARAGLVERDLTPGAAVAGLLALVARYTQLVGAAVLVAVVLGPAAGALVAGCAGVARFGNRGSLTRWSAIIAGLSPHRRRLRYVVDTGTDPALGKEIRMLGILPWWRDRTRTEATTYLRPLWAERRRIYFLPFLGYTAVTLAGAIVVLAQLRSAAGRPGFSVLELSLAIQAVLVPLRFGVFFPESDVQTQYGMRAHETLTGLERDFAAGARAGTGMVTPEPAPGSAPAPGLPRTGIRFEQVRFAYPRGGRDVLANLDLELPAGRSTAVVGLNGTGKTTLIKLLARLHEPTAGRITVDGTDLRDLDARAWQRRLAVIFQDYVRYELDAATNIGLGRPDQPDDTVALLAAAERAGAGDVLAGLPAGLATPLSSRYPGGVELSGGQWQRIALARALYAVGGGASVLVLDEPTAQLDARAETAFFDRFLTLTGGLTTVVVSHRFSTVRRADRIVVLDGGRVAEAGAHDELLRRGGRYAELFHLQARRFVEEPA